MENLNSNDKRLGFFSRCWQTVVRVFKYFTLFEKLWMLFLVAVSVTVAILTDDVYWLAFVTLIAGILCEIMVCKRNRANFGFSIVNDIGEGIIMMQARLYAGAGLNFLFWVPNDIISFINWRRHKEQKVPIHTKVRTLKWWHFIILFAVLLALSYPAGLLLELAGEADGYLDSLAAFLEITSAILILLRFRDYTFIWFIVAFLRIYLYSVNAEWLMVIMYVGYLGTTVYGYYCWTKSIKKGGYAPPQLS